MNSARTSLFLHLLSACALMAYTVVACTVTPDGKENQEPPAESIVADATDHTPPAPRAEQEMK